MRLSLLLSSLLLTISLHAENVDEALSGFDDEPTETLSSTDTSGIQDGFDDDTKSNATEEVTEEGFFADFSGKFTQQLALSYNTTRPQNIFASLRQSLFLYYEHKFENGIKVKVNGRGFYDPMYDSTSSDYYPAEVDELRTEVEIFEAYVEGNIMENLDARLGRQVVVWGKSDTIRVTDILNPIDSRRPGYQDLEDLYFPTTMLKFDYQYDENWRISPIVILEQRFTKDPPLGSIYHPASPKESYSKYKASGKPVYTIAHDNYNDPTFALSIGGEFEGWDINFYAARVYEARGFIPTAELKDNTLIDKKFQHNKTNMFGAAFNIVEGSWLFKAELAYFDNLTYSTEQDDGLSRTDVLLGFEYSGFADTSISYDVALRHFNQADFNIKYSLENYAGQDTYQHALRLSSSFMRDTLDANYLISLYGEKLDEGGYQRAWVNVDLADAINSEIGVIDYFGGSQLFDLIEDQVVVFMDISYSF